MVKAVKGTGIGAESDLDAAEFAVGTLSGADRAVFTERLMNEPHLRARVDWWEQRFASLASAIAPIEPGPHLWERIKAEVAAPPQADETGSTLVLPKGARDLPGAANDNGRAALIASRRRWRLGAMAASLAAIALGALAFSDTVRDRALPTIDRLAGAQREPAAGIAAQDYIAVVNAAGDAPALVVSVNGATKEVRVRSLGIEAPQGKSLELWYIAEGVDPVPVGLIGQEQTVTGTFDTQAGATLAVSVEPNGGSPSGQPTGEVVYTGKLVADPGGN